MLVVGPDTATGLISALTVRTVAAKHSPQFDAATSTLAVLIGVVFILFGLLRLGWVAAFIPCWSATRRPSAARMLRRSRQAASWTRTRS